MQISQIFFHFLLASTRALYSQYMGFVLAVHGACTRSTWALYLTKTIIFNYGTSGRNRNIFVDFEILVFFRNEY